MEVELHPASGDARQQESRSFKPPPMPAAGSDGATPARARCSVMRLAALCVCVTVLLMVIAAAAFYMLHLQHLGGQHLGGGGLMGFRGNHTGNQTGFRGNQTGNQTGFSPDPSGIGRVCRTNADCAGYHASTCHHAAAKPDADPPRPERYSCMVTGTPFFLAFFLSARRLSGFLFLFTKVARHFRGSSIV